MMKALFQTVVFLSLAGLVWTYVADASANPSVPAEHVGLITLVGVVFMVGGVYSIAEAFGMVPPMRDAISRRHD